MKKLQKVICSAFVAGALLCQSLLPGFAVVSELESVTNIHTAYTNSRLLSSVHVLKKADRICTSDFSAVLEPGEYVGIAFHEIRNVSEVTVKHQGDAALEYSMNGKTWTPLAALSGEPVAMGYIRLINNSDSPIDQRFTRITTNFDMGAQPYAGSWNGGGFPVYSGGIQDICDGDPDTVFITKGHPPVGTWYQVDCGAPVEIEQIRLLTAVTDGIFGADIEVSLDGGSWTKVGESPNDPDAYYEQDRVVTVDNVDQTARYVRVRHTQKVNDGWWVRIREIEVNTAQGEAPLTAVAPPLLFNGQADSRTDALLDNDATTKFESAEPGELTYTIINEDIVEDFTVSYEGAFAASAQALQDGEWMPVKLDKQEGRAIVRLRDFPRLQAVRIVWEQPVTLTGMGVSSYLTNKAALAQAVSLAGRMSTVGMSDGQLADWRNTLVQARALLDSPVAAQREIDGCHEQIFTLANGFVKLVDKQALLDQMQIAALVQPSLYTPESYAQFERAYDAAKQVANSETFTQARVDRVAGELRGAVDALEFAGGGIAVKGAPENGFSRAALTLEADRPVYWSINGTEQARLSKTLYLTAENAYAVQARDEQGERSVLLQFTIDRTKPVLTATCRPGAYVTGDVTFTASEEVTFYNRDQAVGEGRTLTLREPGRYKIRAVDKAGNYCAFYTVEIENEALVLEGAPENGYTRDNVLLAADRVVKFYINGTLADQYGKSLKIVTPGAYMVRAVDMAGNETTVSFVIDRTKPTFTATVPSGQPTGGPITLQASETVQFVVGEEAAATGTTFTIEEDGLTVVRIYDLAGNYGGGYKASIDRSAPLLTAVLEGTDEAVENGAAVHKNVTVKSSEPAQFIVNGGAPTARANFVKLRADGVYTVQAVDMLGNVSEAFTVTIRK